MLILTRCLGSGIHSSFFNSLGSSILLRNSSFLGHLARNLLMRIKSTVDGLNDILLLQLNPVLILENSPNGIRDLFSNNILVLELCKLI